MSKSKSCIKPIVVAGLTIGLLVGAYKLIIKPKKKAKKQKVEPKAIEANQIDAAP